MTELPRKRRRRKPNGSDELWCSWGRHRTYRQPNLKEQYDHGSICLTCQVEIMSNLETVVPMPELSIAQRMAERKRWEDERAQRNAVAPLKKRMPDAEGLVYYIRINGQVKIGYTANLKQRSRAYPPGSELLAVEPGGRDVEAQRHRQFARDLAKGREWFHESTTLAEHIAGLVGKFGKPDALMYKYKAHGAARKVNANG